MKRYNNHIAIRPYESPEEYRKRLLRNFRKNQLLRSDDMIDKLVEAAKVERKKTKGKKIIAARAKMFDTEYEFLREDIRQVMRTLTNQRHYCARTDEPDGVDFCNEFMRLLRKARTIMKTRQNDGLEPRHWSEMLDRREWRGLFEMYAEMGGAFARRFQWVMDKAKNFEGYEFHYKRHDPRLAMIASKKRTGKPNEVLQDS